ncbi:hypothetical protein [Kordiimonas pumila]|uniref:Uncharacterized protein n=1 Tax=Kordiimonas pumila TaxID=2161677 RepID=A0ABV7D9W2_9PROT|nr:hypothetical protein [Kordiimonas pumila]
MKKQNFEQYVLRYGTEIVEWPAVLQAKAATFAETEAGKAIIIQEKRFSEMFSSARTLTAKRAVGQGTDAFLDRLCSIPATHLQQQKQQGLLARLWSMLAPDGSFLSPAALVSEMAVFVVVLGLGVFAGMNGVGDSTSQAEVDISDGWFALTLDITSSEDGLEG